MLRRLLITCASLMVGALVTPAQQDQSLQVQLHYTGAGTVDSTHKIFVALWDSADLTGGPPADVKSVTSKDGTVTFSDIKTSPVFVSAAYDPSGQWDAASPPPSGASLGMYSKAPPKPDPIPLTPGKVVKVTISFDDTVKEP